MSSYASLGNTVRPPRELATIAAARRRAHLWRAGARATRLGPIPAASYKEVVKWSMWPGAGILVGSGLTSFALDYKSLGRAFSGLGALLCRNRGANEGINFKAWLPSASGLGIAMVLPGSNDIAWMGCAAKETASIDLESLAKPTTAELTQDAKYMGQPFKQRSNGAPFISLDLGDQRQYVFVIRRLLHAGKTPSNSPRLFQRLRDIHAAHLSSFAHDSRAGGVKAASEVTTASNVGGSGTRCGHMLVTPGSFASNMYNADSSALMSCFNGMDYVSIDQAIYDTDEDETFLNFLTSNFQEDFAGIEVRTPVLRGSVAAGQNHSVLVDSFGFAEDDTTGEFESTYTRYKTEAETPATLRAGSAGQFAALVATNTLDHPRDATGDVAGLGSRPEERQRREAAAGQ